MNPADRLKEWTGRTKEFYLEVRSETRKVSWPSRQEVFGTTLVVIAAVFFFGLYLGVVDYLLSYASGWVYKYFGLTT